MKFSNIFFITLSFVLGSALLARPAFAEVDEWIYVPEDEIVMWEASVMQIEFDQNDNFYYANKEGFQVDKFTPDNEHVQSYNPYPDYYFSQAEAQAIDSNNNVYVMDRIGDEVVVFNEAGVEQFTFGSAGSGNGEFNNATDLVFDEDDLLYVADRDNDRIQIFDSSGNYQGEWSVTGPLSIAYNPATDRFLVSTHAGLGTATVIELDDNGNTLLTINYAGAEQVDYDSQGNIYVTDLSNGISKHNSSGTEIDRLDTTGTAQGELDSSFAAFGINSQDEIYTIEEGYRIQILDTDFNFVDEILVSPYTDIRGIASDSSDNLYILDGSVVTVLDSNFSEIDTWGSFGSGNGQFDDPEDMAINSQDEVVISDSDNDRIQVLDTDGTFLFEFGTSGPGNLNDPQNIAIDEDDNIYVSEGFFSSGRVLKFDEDGNYLATIATYGTGNGQVHGPRGLAFDSTGRLYIVDDFNNRLQRFVSDSFDTVLLTGISSNNIAISSSDEIFLSDPDSFSRREADGTEIETLFVDDRNSFAFGGISAIHINSSNQIFVGDSGYGGLQAFFFEYQVDNLDASLDVLNNADENIEIDSPDGVTPDTNTAKVLDNTSLISEVPIEFTSDQDWAGLTTERNGDQDAVYTDDLTALGGTLTSFSLYVPIPEKTDQASSQVVVCPNATGVASATESCSGGVTLEDGGSDTLNAQSVSATRTTLDSSEFWLIGGLSGDIAAASLYESTLPAEEPTSPEEEVNLENLEVDLFSGISDIGLKSGESAVMKIAFRNLDDDKASNIRLTASWGSGENQATKAILSPIFSYVDGSASNTPYGDQPSINSEKTQLKWRIDSIPKESGWQEVSFILTALDSLSQDEIVTTIRASISGASSSDSDSFTFKINSPDYIDPQPEASPTPTPTFTVTTPIDDTPIEEDTIRTDDEDSEENEEDSGAPPSPTNPDQGRPNDTSQQPFSATVEELARDERVLGAQTTAVGTVAGGVFVASLLSLGLTGGSVSSLATVGSRLVRGWQAVGIIPIDYNANLVFSTKTGKGIPFTRVELRVNSKGQEITEFTTTNENGFFSSISMPKGKLELVANHPQFSFPTKAQRPVAVSPEDFYKADTLSHSRNGHLPSIITPLDSSSSYQAEKEGLLTKAKYIALSLVGKVTRWSWFVSLPLTLFITTISFSWLNLLVLIFLLTPLVPLINNRRKYKPVSGNVQAAAKKKRGALVRWYDQTGISRGVTRVADSGRFFFRATTGKYSALAYPTDMMNGEQPTSFSVPTEKELVLKIR